MSVVFDLLANNRKDELWQLCCGFLDLSLEQFMGIQKSLLLEQIELLKKCELGRKIFRGALPNSVEEFRRQVPLTTYADYCPYLLDKREDMLPAKPIQWTQTLGRSGEYPYKTIPITKRFWEEAGIDFSAVAILASCQKKGEFSLRKGMKSLYAASGLPYLTAAVVHRAAEDLGFEFLPDIQVAEGLPFEQRVEKGFNMALSEGMDSFFGIAGVLVAIGKKFNQSSGANHKRKLPKDVRSLARLTKGYIKSKRAGRRLMPKDLWDLDIIAAMGTDSLVYKDKIKELWGRNPLNVYGNTETTVVATQTWDYKYMTFFPNLNFFEFIPEDAYLNTQENKSRFTKTVLLDEVQPGRLYELVITSFHGGAMIRYRTGELIRITAMRNEKLGINLPQMINEGRVDDLMDLTFVRVNERIIWQALENTHIPYREWTARKEIGDTPRLHLYIELSNGYNANPDDLAKQLYEEIKKLDGGVYVFNAISSIEDLIEFTPIVVTILPEGVFSGFKATRQAQGAALTETKPPHVNPSDSDLEVLETQYKNQQSLFAGRN
jgi:hypothetical protein